MLKSGALTPLFMPNRSVVLVLRHFIAINYVAFDITAGFVGRQSLWAWRSKNSHFDWQTDEMHQLTQQSSSPLANKNRNALAGISPQVAFTSALLLTADPVSRLISCLLAFLSLFVSGLALSQQLAAPAQDSKARVLLARHAELQSQLAKNAYGRPLVIESSEGTGNISGNAYAILDFRFEDVSSAFKSPGRWCEVMILHINTKYCKAGAEASPSTLKVNVGRKTPQQLSDAYALEFAMRVVQATPQYMAVLLNADKGPLSTTNYRIELEAVPLEGNKTFMHLRYSYGYGLAGKLAMQGYLATLGSGKFGFTRIEAGGKPVYVGGMRGAVERNTMRYYLAIESYLSTANKPPAMRFEYWFDATEQYRLQLHESDRASYLSMKKDEYQRQTASSGTGG